MTCLCALLQGRDMNDTITGKITHRYKYEYGTWV
jgi:hypothetical protein